MLPIDGWMVEKIEQLAHAIQRRTGWNNYQVAFACGAGSCLAPLLAPIFPDLAPLSERLVRDRYVAFCALSIVMICLLRLLMAAQERAAEKRMKNGVANEDKNLVRSTIRLVLITLGTCDFTINSFKYGIDVPYTISFALGIAYWYFIAGDPLPPCAGTIREKIKELFSPTPIPAPISAR